MPRIYDVCLAKCPFFISSGKKSIKCEGVVDDSVIDMGFSSETQRNIFREKYCNSNYQDCVVHRMLEEKYIE